MKKKNILIIRRDLGGFGGIEKQILTLTSSLIEKGIVVHFITNQLQSVLAQRMTALGALVTQIDLSNVVWGGIRVNNYCRSHSISIIQTHMLKESFIARIVKLINNKIYHIFRVHTYIDCSRISSFKKNVYHFFSKLTDIFVDCYLSINDFNVKELTNRTKISKSKIQVIPNSIKGNSLECAKIDLPIKNIGMIANLIPFKGHDILIKGIKLLQDDGYSITATIIGGEDKSATDAGVHLLDDLKEMASRFNISDQIIFTGFVSDVEKYICNIPIIVLPSYAEGTPNSLLEAMSMKKIVIASKVGGIPEFIEDGVNGFLHDPLPESFASALKRTLKLSVDEINEITQNAYNTWFNNFSEEMVSEQYSKLILEILTN